MAEGGTQQIVIHIHSLQQGDKNDIRVEKKAETNITNSAIEQVNVQQQETNDDTTEDPVAEEQDVIIRGVDEMNQASPIQILVKKTESTSLDQEERCSDRTGTGMIQVRKHSLRCELLRAQAANLCEQSKYLEAASRLEKLKEIQQEDVELNSLFMMAEVNIQLGRNHEAEEALKNIVRMSVASPLDVADAINFAVELIDGKFYVRALVLLRISSDIYNRHSSLSPNDKVEKIRACVSKMDEAVDHMIKLGGSVKNIALSFGLPCMIRAVGDLRAVEKADPTNKAIQEAWCGNEIGYNYMKVDEHEKSIEFYKPCVELLNKQFGDDASKHQIYGVLLNNLGVSKYELRKYAVAKKYYKKAIDAKNNALDFNDEAEKQKSIGVTQTNLAGVKSVERKHLG